MKRSQLSPMPEYFDRYINKCDDVEVIDAIQISIDELNQIPIDTWNTLANDVYAPGKWTIPDILQHLIDTERIFNYRALAFARNESQALPSFDENEYALKAEGKNRTVNNLIDELRVVHQSTKAMFTSFAPDMLNRKGLGFKGEYSVASIGFLLPGHQRWHFQTIRERYVPLLNLV